MISISIPAFMALIYDEFTRKEQNVLHINK